MQHRKLVKLYISRREISRFARGQVATDTATERSDEVVVVYVAKVSLPREQVGKSASSGEPPIDRAFGLQDACPRPLQEVESGEIYPTRFTHVGRVGRAPPRDLARGPERDQLNGHC